MAKVAVVVLADTESPGDLGRGVNAMMTAKELKENNDEVQIVFDGAGTKWVPTLSNSEHKYHDLFASVRDEIAGVCSYCASAYGVKNGVQTSGVQLLEDFEEHPSLRKYITEGYQIITF
ncbi:DsrE family protein [candidate division KSB1 bacterium]|nr:DsrE family protein [candidate division KSB1 bacterium]NIR73340.1 DsrE family protein [candidate division KSB1 bacterium]NIS27046.1 DsrE family protein [candidate division KSB1 bacterium]NIT73886.1 DsrE family protein [candidate division KSB1 bacterium]NIU27791.1 DsrE family protein [candidate division KSB1 bacterium]